MKDYKRTPTTKEVFVEVTIAHPDLIVFGSYSAPCGDWYGDSTKGRMFASFGFTGCDYPVIETETTWDICVEEPHKRNNEKQKYWLCLPIRDNS